MNMNPDGTEQKALYGSGSMFPNSTFDIQPLPGHGSAFVGIISGHHGIARSGRLIVFDPAKARKRPLVWYRRSRIVTGRSWRRLRMSW